MIGIDPVGIQTEVFDPVICSRAKSRVSGSQVTRAGISAAHQQQSHFIGHNGPVFIYTGFDIHDIMGPGGGGAQMLLPGKLHFDGSFGISFLGQGQRGGNLFRLGFPAAEASTHMGGNDDPDG